MAMTPDGPARRGRPEDAGLAAWTAPRWRVPAAAGRPAARVARRTAAFTVATEDGRTRRWTGRPSAPAQPAHQRRPALCHRVVGTRVEVEATSVAPRVVRVGTSAQYVVVHSYAGTPPTCPLGRPDRDADLAGLLPRRARADGGRGRPGAGCWCRTCTCGRSLPWMSGVTLTVDEPGTWSAGATTTTAIPGASNVSKATDHDTDTTSRVRPGRYHISVRGTFMSDDSPVP